MNNEDFSHHHHHFVINTMFNAKGYRVLSHAAGDTTRHPLEAANDSLLNRLDGEEDSLQRSKRLSRRSWFWRREASSPRAEDMFLRFSRNSLTEQQKEMLKQSFKDSLRASLPSSTRSLHQVTQVAPDKQTLNLTSILPERPRPLYQRVVVFHQVPLNIGITAILSQASGGPLEKIIVVEKSDAEDQETSVRHITRSFELHFRDVEAGFKFNEYARSGRFVVNSMTLFPSDEVDTYNIKEDSEDVTEANEIITAMITGKVRRCVVLKERNINHEWLKTTQSTESFEQIRIAFEVYGHIVSIMPQLSEHRSISIQYSDVRSAIQAKKSFDSRSSTFRNMYKIWKLSYGHDPVDHNVPAPL